MKKGFNRISTHRLLVFFCFTGAAPRESFSGCLAVIEEDSGGVVSGSRNKIRASNFSGNNAVF